MSDAKVPDSDVKPADDVQLEYNFRQAVAGDLHAQALWQAVEGGGWQWAREGALVKRTEAEWSALAYQGWQVAQAAGPQNFGSVVKVPQKEEVMVSSWEQLTTN
jgi:hypothetical protein